MAYIPNWGAQSPNTDNFLGMNNNQPWNMQNPNRFNMFGAEPMNDFQNVPNSFFSSPAAYSGGTTGYNPLEFGMNIPTFQLGLTGLGTLGSLWGGYQSQKLAKDAFNFSKSMAEQNYANSVKAYNTALTDTATSRGFVQGDTAEETQQYIDENKL